MGTYLYLIVYYIYINIYSNYTLSFIEWFINEIQKYYRVSLKFGRRTTFGTYAHTLVNSFATLFIDVPGEILLRQF